jgi:hypothetical protein
LRSSNRSGSGTRPSRPSGRWGSGIRNNDRGSMCIRSIALRVTQLLEGPKMLEFYRSQSVAILGRSYAEIP